MHAIDRYREHCSSSPALPVFHQPWWLDAVCGAEAWNVVLAEKGGKLVGSLPYTTEKRRGFHVSSMPRLTQFLGPNIVYPPDQKKHYARLSWEKEIVGSLLEQLPNFSHFSQALDRKLFNALPYYWHGFQNQLLYTYVIPNSLDIDVDKALHSKVRSKIKQNVKNGISVHQGITMEEFYSINKQTFERQGRPIPYSLEFVENIHSRCLENNSVTTMYARNADGVITSAAFFVHDFENTYYLMGGINKDFTRSSGMESVLLEAIKLSLEKGRNFDFEGSMVESIESFFRSFGAIQTPYIMVTKTNSKLYKLKNSIRDLIA